MSWTPFGRQAGVIRVGSRATSRQSHAQSSHEGFPAGCLRASRGRREGEFSIWGVGGFLNRRQALIDAGRAEGVKSFEADELAQALKTIAELEAVKAASALFNGEEPISPKAVPGCPKPEQPGLHGALRMPDRRRLTALLLRVQVPRAIGSPDPRPPAQWARRQHPQALPRQLRHVADPSRPHAGTEHGGAYGIRRQSVYS